MYRFIAKGATSTSPGGDGTCTSWEAARAASGGGLGMERSLETTKIAVVSMHMSDLRILDFNWDSSHRFMSIYIYIYTHGYIYIYIYV